MYFFSILCARGKRLAVFISMRNKFGVTNTNVSKIVMQFAYFSTNYISLSNLYWSFCVLYFRCGILISPNAYDFVLLVLRHIRKPDIILK